MIIILFRRLRNNKYPSTAWKVNNKFCCWPVFRIAPPFLPASGLILQSTSAASHMHAPLHHNTPPSPSFISRHFCAHCCHCHYCSKQTTQCHPSDLSVLVSIPSQSNLAMQSSLRRPNFPPSPEKLSRENRTILKIKIFEKKKNNGKKIKQQKGREECAPPEGRCKWLSAST